nr:histone acetyltransferase HAC1-like isoform X3 [Tanacetum cinerariifolium]
MPELGPGITPGARLTCVSSITACSYGDVISDTEAFDSRTSTYSFQQQPFHNNQYTSFTENKRNTYNMDSTLLLADDVQSPYSNSCNMLQNDSLQSKCSRDAFNFCVLNAYVCYKDMPADLRKEAPFEDHDTCASALIVRSSRLVTLPADPFAMSLEESDDLVILDAELVSPTLETGSLPKFNMHLHKSFLTETQVKWLAKCYDFPEDLHPRVAPEGMTMNVLPNSSIGLYAHHFRQGD